MNQGYTSNQGYPTNQPMPPQYNNQPQYAQDPNYGQYNQPLYSKEQQGGGSFDFDQMARLGFIRKVFGILSAQLLLSTIFVLGAVVYTSIKGRDDAIKQLISSNIILPLYVICVFAIIITAILICCCFRRVFPANYICLGIFTLAESFILFLICASYPPDTVLIALALTTAVTIGLTVYAMITKTDFTYCGAFLWMFLFSFIVFMILFFLCVPRLDKRIKHLYIGICCVGVIIYSLYLIYDTQLVMGKCGVEYSIDDYVFAALNLYLDIINLFLYILRIVGAAKDG